MSKINIKTSEKRFPVAPDLYGIFFEDISHAGDGGLYPEMLRNRSFEDSILPEGCVSHDGGKTFVSPTGWIDEFNGGEGMNDWVTKNQIVPTPIPAWYSENAEMSLDDQDTLNDKRKVSLCVDFQPGGRIRNIGYIGIPQYEGKAYHFYAFLKTEKPVTLAITIEENGDVLSSAEIEARGNGWVRYDCSLVGTRTTGDAAFYITCREGGTVRFGFASLMPADTFNGHGLRRDLVEKLRDMNPAFLRFPGGCIVEGFSMETVMYFRNVVGPVWERPSHWLLWHYRATNGLGYHEYLQLCEDLNLSPMYVCNCGMTCQARKPYFFNDEELQDVIQDTLNAIEYAVGPADSEWGSLRARMGHEAPFGLEYLEIGNENFGPEYARCYNIVRDAVLARYPDLKIIANERGREEKLKADIADDHYYNMPEFFAENYDMYKDYDRNEPDIFVGEFAVNQTYEGQHRAAIAEAMYMVGMERNQDVVKLASYAPLFQHVCYSSWYPNLLIYDNYRSYTIPTYYCWRLFGGNRGNDVVESTEEFDKIFLNLAGLPAVTGDYGVRYRSIRWNGAETEVSHEVFGKLLTDGDDLVLTETPAAELQPDGCPSLVTFGEDETSREGKFEAEFFAEPGKEAGVGFLCAPKPLSFYDRNNPNPVDPWEMRFLEMFRWVIKDGKAAVVRGSVPSKVISEEKEVKLIEGAYNKISYEIHQPMISLYLNDELIDTAELPSYQSMCSVVTDTDDEVIIKAVNFADTDDDIEITLDCDVAADYTVALLTGQAEDENCFANPECVHDVLLHQTGAARSFTYHAPSLSVNVLRLKKA